LYKRILIANRGEIALRIIRACRELGVETVAAYSTADEDSLHVRFADHAVRIGPGPSSESYLNRSALIAAAEVSGADALHPGYGFLAENADFADMCVSHGIAFIGPSGDMIRRMGDKAVAKQLMKSAGVPVIPGSDGEVDTPEEAQVLAREMGFPVILKASAGGGGRGMRIAHSETDVASAFTAASQEALSGFGNGALYLEKYIVDPRHVELQILGDAQGNIIHLNERDCSIQRRHQKLVEESPSPAVSQALREKMGTAAVDAARSVNYQTAGTIEFLLDEDENYYFMEMNTRIQVEHPITEQITGIDLIVEQIRTAAGEELRTAQHQVVPRGHAIECRINAEDPNHNFRPCPGRITSLNLPGGLGVRVDTHVYAGYVIPPYYDSLIAKLIVHAETRAQAVRRLQRALDEFIIEGIANSIPYHIQVVNDPAFVSGNFNTSFVEHFEYREEE
jgi:acetyl-CoA carboxylase, biotin carboxylase subunit